MLSWLKTTAKGLVILVLLGSLVLSGYQIYDHHPLVFLLTTWAICGILGVSFAIVMSFTLGRLWESLGTGSKKTVDDEGSEGYTFDLTPKG